MFQCRGSEKTTWLPQASAFQLRLQREAETKEREKAAAAKAAAAKRVVSEEDYSQLVDVRRSEQRFHSNTCRGLVAMLGRTLITISPMSCGSAT